MSATCGKWSVGRSRWWRLRLLAVVFGLSTASSVSGVPKRVANRMVPNWWSKVSEVCYSSSDCQPEECCTRPMLSLKTYCMPMRTRGQVCNKTPYLLNESKEVYFNDCPCLPGYSCSNIYMDSHANCIDLHELALDFRRFISDMNQAAKIHNRGIPSARRSS